MFLSVYRHISFRAFVAVNFFLHHPGSCRKDVEAEAYVTSDDEGAGCRAVPDGRQEGGDKVALKEKDQDAQENEKEGVGDVSCQALDASENSVLGLAGDENQRKDVDGQDL